MSTKVRGDKIKEGSIPLSALSNEVKDKIENAGGGADWNAQKGEAGYIENKPIIKNFIKEQSMEFNEVDEWNSIDEGYDAVPSNTTVAKVFADITTSIGEHITTTVIVKKGESVDIFENDEADYLAIRMYDTSEGLTMNVGASFGFGGTLKCYYYEEFKQLDEDYIPDTIARKTDIPTDTIKTTPQTLSDNAKNQALANLGIPRVLNINIYGIEDNLTIDELSEILGDCVTNEILILGLCYRSKYSTVYLPTLHQSYTDFDGRKILNKLVCGQYRVDEDSYDFHLVVYPSVYLYYDEDTQNYRYFLEEY